MRETDVAAFVSVAAGGAVVVDVREPGECRRACSARAPTTGSSELPETSEAGAGRSRAAVLAGDGVTRRAC